MFVQHAFGIQLMDYSWELQFKAYMLTDFCENLLRLIVISVNFSKIYILRSSTYLYVESFVETLCIKGVSLCSELFRGKCKQFQKQLNTTIVIQQTVLISVVDLLQMELSSHNFMNFEFPQLYAFWEIVQNLWTYIFVLEVHSLYWCQSHVFMWL